MTEKAPGTVQIYWYLYYKKNKNNFTSDWKSIAKEDFVTARIFMEDIPVQPVCACLHWCPKRCYPCFQSSILGETSSPGIINQM